MSNADFTRNVWIISAINTLTTIVGIVINDRKLRQLRDHVKAMVPSVDRELQPRPSDRPTI